MTERLWTSKDQPGFILITNNPEISVAWTSLVAQTVMNLPSMQDTQVQSLGWEDPLKKRMATNSSILAWRIPWAKEPGGTQSMGSWRVGHD